MDRETGTDSRDPELVKRGDKLKEHWRKIDTSLKRLEAENSTLCKSKVPTRPKLRGYLMNIKVTRTCPKCRKDSVLEVSAKAYLAWQRGTLIQRAFPDMAPEQREILITGLHPACWKEIFQGVEDDDI